VRLILITLTALLPRDVVASARDLDDDYARQPRSARCTNRALTARSRTLHPADVEPYSRSHHRAQTAELPIGTVTRVACTATAYDRRRCARRPLRYGASGVTAPARFLDAERSNDAQSVI